MSKKCLFCYQPIDNGQDFHATCSKSFFGTETPPILDYTLDDMTELAKKIVETSVTVPGVQPKLSLGIIKNTIDKNKRLTIVGALGGNFILKPQNTSFPEMPENEDLTMKLAEHCSILTVPHTLIRLKSGELSYLTKRVDRTVSGKKNHMLDMYQILEAYDKYKGSMEKIGKAIQTYSENTLLDLTRFFELIVFSYITGNNDMHLKNFSFIHKNNSWKLAPAYDLLNVALHLPEDKEEMALTMKGKKRRLTKEDFNQFGTTLGLNDKQIQNTYNRFVNAESQLLQLIDYSFLSSENQKKYKLLLIERIKIFKGEL